MSDIFVQIASYRDPQLVPTVLDAIEKRSGRHRLVFGICHQYGEEGPDLPLPRDVVRVLAVPYRDSQGVCWARCRIQEFYAGEEYALQLDSHHRFAPDWDDRLVEMLRSIPSAKPLLTAYLPSFDPAQPEKLASSPWRMDFDRFTPEGAVFFRPAPVEKPPAAPFPARFCSAHFCFAPGRFVREVPYDPYLYFHGEEINLTVRAFTHGYDLYHPHEALVWHEYTREGRRKHWDDHVEANALRNWWERNEESHRRNRLLFGMESGQEEIDFGPYGFGAARTIRDYERYAGIHFRLRGVQEYTLAHRPPPNPHPYADDAEWERSFFRERTIEVELAPEEVEDDPAYDFWYVGLKDRSGMEIFRRDLNRESVLQVLAGRPRRFSFTYHGSGVPALCLVWPHSERRGWRRQIERQLA